MPKRFSAALAAAYKGRKERAPARFVWNDGSRYKTPSAVILRAEIQLNVEFFFKKVGAAFGVSQVLSGVAVRLDLKGNGSAVKGSVQRLDALAVRVIEAFGDAHDRGQTPGNALVVAVQGRVGGMVAGGF